MSSSTVAKPIAAAHKWWALVAVCFGLFMALLDITIVNVALPTIQHDLGASFTDLQWVINAYALVFAVVLVTSARLGDIFGRKWVFILGLAVFTLGSLFCALSGDIVIGTMSHIDILNIARGVQGLGASAMMPLSLAIISATFEGHERGKAIGIWGGISGIATAIGPLVGGFLVDKVSWQSIFMLNVPIGIVGILLSMWAIRNSRDEHAAKWIDVFGIVTVSAFMFCLILGLMQANDSGKGWTSPYILRLFIIAAVALIAFIIGELRMKHPMVDPRLFKNASFTGAAIAAFCLSGGLYALFFFLTLYFQNFLGFDALQTGLRFLPLSALVLVGAPLAGRFTDKVGARSILFTGMAFLTVSVFLMTRISPADKASDWIVLLPAFIVGGIGNGIVNPPISTVAVGAAPQNKAGMASGINNVCRQIGIAFGIAFLGAILSRRYDALVNTRIHALHAPGLTDSVKTQISNGVQQAGSMAGSEGLPVTGHQSAYAHLPMFHQIQQIARASFVDGTVDILRIAAVMLLIGALAAILLIKKSDMMHR